MKTPSGLVLAVLFPATVAAQAPVALGLDSAVALAARTNPGVAILRQRVLEAQSRSLERGSLYYPRLLTSTTLSQVGERQRLAIPRGVFGVLASGEPVPLQPVVLPQGGTSLLFHTTRIEQPLTQLFRIRAGHQAAVAEEGASVARLTQAEGDLSLGVARAYYGLVVAEGQVRAAQARLAADSALAADAAASADAGLTLPAMAEQAAVRLLEARRQLREEQYRAEDLALELADLIGAPVGTRFHLSLPPDPGEPAGPLESYLASAAEANPELRAALEQVARARQGVAAARADYLPEVGVFIQHLYQSAVPLFPASQFSAGVKVEWTLWDFRQRDHQLAERRAVAEQARLETERVRRRVDSDVIRAHRSVERALDAARVAEQALAARREGSRLAADQVAVGLATEATRLAALAAETQAAADLLEAVSAVRLARMALDRAAGRAPY